MVINMVMKRGSAQTATDSIPAGEFKARCLALMDKVGRDGRSVTITKRGKPVAVLSPIRVVPTSGFGFARDGILGVGDLLSPIDVAWDAAT